MRRNIKDIIYDMGHNENQKRRGLLRRAIRTYANWNWMRGSVDIVAGRQSCSRRLETRHAPGNLHTLHLATPKKKKKEADNSFFSCASYTKVNCDAGQTITICRRTFSPSIICRVHIWWRYALVNQVFCWQTINSVMRQSIINLQLSKSVCLKMKLASFSKPRPP